MTATITVYRAGNFTSEPEPAWRQAARAYADRSEWGWTDSVSAELECDGNRIALHQADMREADATYWTLRSGGHYVEFRCWYLRIEAVLVPDPADWLSFYIGFVAPFLQAHATVSATYRQNRIANVLTAWARHGEGEHVHAETGISTLDRPLVAAPIGR
jgi:hypothetical protein